ncbi:hypothetical protein [Citricoccus muralis]|uniref:hypothetical protein n=1 Tax=Citricoccus muralis TaxID=169134 RepID=UPI0011C05BC4|nr:hypothetical protein [Citricoccus muralis]
MASTAFSSASSLLLSIFIARSGTIADVAMFAIGFAGYMAITGLTRAMVSEPSAARLMGIPNLRISGRQVSAYGLLIGAVALVAGFLAQQPYLVIVGILSHSIALADYAKFVSMVFGHPRMAVTQEFMKLAIVSSGLLIPSIRTQPLILFTLWLIASAATGYISCVLQKISLLPSLRGRQVSIKESSSYATDYALGSGATQLTTFLLGGIAAHSVNASVRGAGTLLGPITVVATSIRALIIPFLSRGLQANANSVTPAANVTIALFVAAIPLTIGVNLIPDSWGHMLLGETWYITRNVLPILSAELIFSLVANVPFAGHRSLGAHRRTLVIRTVMAPLRVTVIVTAAVIGGYIWAAFAMLLTSAVSATVWWISYRSLVKGNL